MTKRTGRNIDPDRFYIQPAISFSCQPNLEALFEEIVHGNEPVTLVIGAGASLDAGLPTWARLLENITELVKEPRWREAITADTLEPARKAEYVTRLAMEGRTGSANDLVRDALYKASADPTFGPLSDAIARLVLAIPSRFRIITTNYDTLLEDAIERYYKGTRPVSRRLADEDVRQWQEAPIANPPSVLHVHGILRPGEAATEPIVLSESTFLKYGRQVREIIIDQLRTSLVVFLAVSMSDPNLIGPLFDTKEERKEPGSALKMPFVMLVADGGRNEAVGEKHLPYVIKRAAFMRDEFEVRPVFSKSYSQQIQVFSDLSLAAVARDRYFDRTSSDSLYYGPRFTQTLNRCYASIGCKDGHDLPYGQASSQLSDRLNQILEDHVVGPDSIVAEYVKLIQDSSAKAKSLGIDNPGSFDAEKFGLFLWLRARPMAQQKYTPYEIRLVGSSAYTHRQPWSLDRTAKVVSFSRHVAAQAIFFGTTNMTNFDENRQWMLWRSAIGVPFTIKSDRSRSIEDESIIRPLDNLLIGAVTLNSTHFIMPSSKDGTKVRSKDRSIISYLNDEDDAQEDGLRKVIDQIADSARQLFDSAEAE